MDTDNSGSKAEATTSKRKDALTLPPMTRGTQAFSIVLFFVLKA